MTDVATRIVLAVAAIGYVLVMAAVVERRRVRAADELRALRHAMLVFEASCADLAAAMEGMSAAATMMGGQWMREFVVLFGMSVVEPDASGNVLRGITS